MSNEQKHPIAREIEFTLCPGDVRGLHNVTVISIGVKSCNTDIVQLVATVIDKKPLEKTSDNVN